MKEAQAFQYKRKKDKMTLQTIFWKTNALTVTVGRESQSSLYKNKIQEQMKGEG